LEEAASVLTEVYDLSGRLVTSLGTTQLAAGRNELTWDCSGSPDGVYFIKVQAGDQTHNSRVVISR